MLHKTIKEEITKQLNDRLLLLDPNFDKGDESLIKDLVLESVQYALSQQKAELRALDGVDANLSLTVILLLFLFSSLSFIIIVFLLCSLIEATI